MTNPIDRALVALGAQFGWYQGSREMYAAHPILAGLAAEIRRGCMDEKTRQ